MGTATLPPVDSRTHRIHAWDFLVSAGPRNWLALVPCHHSEAQTESRRLGDVTVGESPEPAAYYDPRTKYSKYVVQLP